MSFWRGRTLTSAAHLSSWTPATPRRHPPCSAATRGRRRGFSCLARSLSGLCTWIPASRDEGRTRGLTIRCNGHAPRHRFLGRKAHLPRAGRLTEPATAKPMGTKARLCQKQICRPARPRSPLSPCVRLVSLITSQVASDEHILVQASVPCGSLDSDRLDTHRRPRPSTGPDTDLRVHPAPLAPARSDERRADLHRHVRLNRDLRGILPASGQAQVATCRPAAWFVSRTGSRHFG